MNPDSRPEQEQHVTFYKRTVSVVGYDIPYWLIMLLILALLGYFYYVRTNGGTRNFTLNFRNNELAPADSVETPSVVRNAIA